MKARMVFLNVTLSFLALWGPMSLPARAENADPLWEKVDKTLGRAGKEAPGEVHKVGWPRSDLKVRVGDVQIEPALALGSWAAFRKTGKEDEVAAMGDLVLLEPEINPVITQLQSGGMRILAVHNHLINESPNVIYLHFSGKGGAAALAKTLKEALEKTKTPTEPSEVKTPIKLSPSEEEMFKRIQAVLGRNGSMAGRVLQVSVPRAEKVEAEGMEIPSGMGVGIPFNFQAVGDRVAATGDFVLVAEEVNPVIRELRSHGIEVTALHSHMLDEAPRFFFLHFWGVDAPEKIAEGLKAVLAHIRTK